MKPPLPNVTPYIEGVKPRRLTININSNAPLPPLEQDPADSMLLFKTERLAVFYDDPRLAEGGYRLGKTKFSKMILDRAKNSGHEVHTVSRDKDDALALALHTLKLSKAPKRSSRLWDHTSWPSKLNLALVIWCAGLASIPPLNPPHVIALLFIMASIHAFAWWMSRYPEPGEPWSLTGFKRWAYSSIWGVKSWTLGRGYGASRWTCARIIFRNLFRKN